MPVTISIIALCYNHAAFLEEALHSLTGLPETVEVLIADDASRDGSVEILRRWQQLRPDWYFLFHEENCGNCRTFNELLGKASGQWILDFATDDLLLTDRLHPWAEYASSHAGCGFCYADALIFHRKGGPVQPFSRGNKPGRFPEGRILHDLFSPGLICPPAVLFSKKVLLEIGGYNEELSYEDMDCWLRIARHHPVCRYPESVILYRQHPGSMSAKIYQGRNQRHLKSTLQILGNILPWPEFQDAPPQLISFIRYHLRLCFFLQLPAEARQFHQLLDNAGEAGTTDRLLSIFSGHCPGISEIYLLFREGRQQWRMRDI